MGERYEEVIVTTTDRLLADTDEMIRDAEEAVRYITDLARRLAAPNEDSIWHLRDGSWHRVDYGDWCRFRGLAKEGWAPLPDVHPGEQHFVFCVVDDGRLYNIIPHRYLIDDAGRIVMDQYFGHYFGLFSGDEIERLESLGKRYYAWPKNQPLTDHEEQEFSAFMHRLWRASLPPPSAMRDLMRVLPALPEEGSAAWLVLEASGFSQSLGRA
jgi:hypothetical protein